MAERDCSRIVDTRLFFKTLQHKRNAGCIVNPKNFLLGTEGKSGTDSNGQHCHGGEYKLPRGTNPGVDQHFQSNMAGSAKQRYDNFCKVFGGQEQPEGRLVVKSSHTLRLPTSSSDIQVFGPKVGPTYNGQMCILSECTSSQVQQSLSRPIVSRGGLPCTTRLESREQLRVPTIPHNTSHTSDTTISKGLSHPHRPMVARSNMVPEACQNDSSATHQNSKQMENIHSIREATGTFEKQEMENLRVEDLWRQQLIDIGWSERAATQIRFCKATSTLRQYNSIVTKFKTFCAEKHVKFVPDVVNTSVFADFLCYMADRSTRPLSVLKCVSAALTFLYECLNLPSPMNSPELRYLVVALVKSGTTEPAKRTRVMPVKPFMDMFLTWKDNSDISIKDLRLKTVTLMALSFMARPSDLAPNAENFDPSTGGASAFQLRRNQIVLHDDGSMTIHMFGTKNDTHRTGFEVRIPASDVAKVDVVKTLQAYMQRTDHLCEPQGPVFIALKAPYKGLTSDGIRKILSEAIEMAGLGGQGYTPRCFRPTGANAAIEAGCTPEEVMQVGRWKTKEVFFDHYVYPKAPANFTSGMRDYTGLHY